MVTQFECDRCRKIYPLSQGTWIRNAGYGMILYCTKCISDTRKEKNSFIKRILNRRD